MRHVFVIGGTPFFWGGSLYGDLVYISFIKTIKDIFIGYPLFL